MARCPNKNNSRQGIETDWVRDLRDQCQAAGPNKNNSRQGIETLRLSPTKWAAIVIVQIKIIPVRELKRGNRDGFGQFSGTQSK